MGGTRIPVNGHFTKTISAPDRSEIRERLVSFIMIAVITLLTYSTIMMILEPN